MLSLSSRENASNLRRFSDVLSLISKVFGWLLSSSLSRLDMRLYRHPAHACTYKPITLNFEPCSYVSTVQNSLGGGGGEVPWFYTFKCNDHNSWTPWSICLILIGELGRTTEIFFNCFWDFNLRESIFKLKLFVLVNNSSIKGKMMKMSDFNM